MRVPILVHADDDSLSGTGLSHEAVLSLALDAIGKEFDKYGLDYDCGYNPEFVSFGGIC